MSAQKTSGDVLLSESFVKNVLPGLRADYLKIYIYAKYTAKEKKTDNKKIAAVLGVEEDTVKSAIGFFEELGLLKTDGGKMQFDVLEKSEDEPPHYEQDAVLDIIAESEELQMLLVSSQKILGKLPSANSTIILYGLYDWLGMSVELILRLLRYCADLGKKDLRYVEKVAISWSEMGIVSCEMADEYIERKNKKNKYAYSIKNIFGIGQRNYTPTEQRYVDSWYEMGFSEELVSYAFDYTVSKTGKLAFAYMNTVLIAWSEQGIKTAEDAKKSVEDFKKKSAGKEKRSTGGKNDYEIYNSGRYDFARIEENARKKIEQRLREDS